jgi:hypothetical protein
VDIPEAVFEALEYVNPAADKERGDKTSVCRLKSWRWSSRLAGKKWPIEKIPEIHLKPSFTTLQKIAFVNYQVPYLKNDEEDPNHEAIIAKALKALPELTHLIFESSTLMNSRLLPMLPTNLRHLELINCWEIVADDFAPFLLTHGSQLRCLTLHHNQSLSLSFLPVLSGACPKLQVFRMNLTYYNLHATYNDSAPQYDHLLLGNQVPAWPSTLQTIELLQMRKWSSEAAETFFQSLLDSAASLPDLRRLTIQAIVNIGWRDRASFRDRWVGSLQRVFKSAYQPPTIHPHVKMSQMSLEDKPAKDEDEEEVKVIAEPRRKSKRTSTGGSSSLAVVIPEQVVETIEAAEEAEEAEEAPPQARRSKRSIVKNVQSGTYAESSDEGEKDGDAYEQLDPVVSRQASRRAGLERELNILKQTAGSDSPPESPQDDDSDDEPLIPRLKAKARSKKHQIIQGMCEVVEIRIDNLRPMETQLTADDFLDEERSGDDDWNGEDDETTNGYAW